MGKCKEEAAITSKNPTVSIVGVCQATVKEELLKSRFTKKDMVVCTLDVLDQLYLYDRMLNGGPLIFRGTELWEENKKYLNYLMPIVEKLELDIQVSDLESEYQKTVTI